MIILRSTFDIFARKVVENRAAVIDGSSHIDESTSEHDYVYFHFR